jgi:hypothetical protein
MLGTEAQDEIEELADLYVEKGVICSAPRESSGDLQSLWG